MNRKRIQFLEWLPDQPDLENGGFEICENAVPVDAGYAAAPTWSPVSESFNGKIGPFTNTSASNLVLGGYIHTDIQATADIFGISFTQRVFVGTQKEIWEAWYLPLGQATSTNVSGTTYGISYLNDKRYWEFTSFDNTVIATNGANNMQYRDANIVDGSFADLNSIKAKTITNARNFVIAGNIIDADGTTPNRVRWSAINDATDWTVSPVTQADYQNLSSANGAVQKIVGGEYAVVFTEKAIYRMSYIGPPLIWRFDEVASGTGTTYPRSVIKVENNIFYHTDEGFHILVDGSKAVPIGYGKVDEWLRLQISSDQRFLTAAADSKNHLVMWTLNGSSNTNILAYDYARNKWGYLKTPDSEKKAFMSSQDGGPQYVYTEAGEYAYLVSSTNTTATTSQVAKVGSAFIEFEEDRNALVTAVIPGRSRHVGATTGLTVSTVVDVVGYESWLDESGATSSATTTGTAGSLARRLSVRKNGRFHKVNITWDVGRQSEANNGDIVSWADVEYTKSHRR